MTKSKAATPLTAGAIFGAVARACAAAVGRAGQRLFDALIESRDREAARILARHSDLFEGKNVRILEPRREETARRKAAPRHAKVLRLSFLIPLAAVAALAALASKAARAADLPTRMYTKAPLAQPIAATYDWSGFYLGGHVGYEWGRTRVEQDGALTEPHAKTNGTDGGALVGYNWQMGAMVAGLEGDFGWSNAHGVGALPPPDPIVTREPNTYDVKWTSHARGRLGYAFDRWLVYGAGGLAVADLDFHEGGVTTTIVGAKYYGWSAGGGVEGAVTENLLARVEYLHDDYGHKDYTGVAGDIDRVSLTGETLRGALVWKFTPAARVQ